MLSKEQISKLTTDKICEYLGKPKRAYDEDILYICEGLKRALGKDCCKDVPSVSDVVEKPKRGRKKKETEEEING